MIHPGACAVSQYEKRCGAGGQHQQGGNFFFIQDGKSQIADVAHRGSLRFTARIY
jgi:hypothetical protein